MSKQTKWMYIIPVVTGMLFWIFVAFVSKGVFFILALLAVAMFLAIFIHVVRVVRK